MTTCNNCKFSSKYGICEDQEEWINKFGYSVCRYNPDAIMSKNILFDLIFERCKIIYYPKNSMEYPLEHNPHAKKDMKEQIIREILK